MARLTNSSQRITVWGKTFMIFSVCAIFFIFAYQGSQEELEATRARKPDTTSPKEVQIKDVEITSTTVSSSSKNINTLRVLCYGDSLTAGMSPPNSEYSPYSTSLQQALDAKTQRLNNPVHYTVSKIGLPGWTTSQFLSILDQENGLRQTIQKQGPFDLMILLAGTNDLPQMLRGVRMDATDVDDSMVTTLTQNLMQLHQVAWSCGVQHTIAVGIPGSAYQDHMSLAAAQLAERVNQRLDLQGSMKTEKMTFVPFPFPYVEGGENWSMDGLHFSRAGYQVLGETLAPVVQSILHPQT